MHLNDFIVAAVVFLAATALSVTVFKRAGLGGILGLLVAGIIIGPYTPGIQITEDVDSVLHFAELGVVMLLFLIGLEMKPARLWSMRVRVFGMGGLQILITGGVLSFVGYSLGLSKQGAVLMGMALALSSTAFVMQMLQEKGDIACRYGQGSFSVLLMQDLAVVPLLALVPIFASKTESSWNHSEVWQAGIWVFFAIGTVIAVGRYIAPLALYRMSAQGNREGFFLVVMFTLFFSVWLVQFAGLSMALGAFLMGMMLSGTPYQHQIEAIIEPFKGVLMSLFFVSVGMSINVMALLGDWLWLLCAIVGVMGAKFAVLWGLAAVFGYSKKDRVRIAVLLSQSGEFAFVLFSAALMADLIHDRAFVLGIGLVSITMLLTPVLVKLVDWLMARNEPVPSESIQMPDNHFANCEGKVIIGGYGRVGRVLARMLSHCDIPYVVIEQDIKLVQAHHKKGVPIFYGDIGDLDLLLRIHVDQSRMVILTANDFEAVYKVLHVIRESFSFVPVVARSRDLEGMKRLLQAGAVEAHPEIMESTLVLGRNTLSYLGVSEAILEKMLEDIRDQNYALYSSEKLA